MKSKSAWDPFVWLCPSLAVRTWVYNFSSLAFTFFTRLVNKTKCSPKVLPTCLILLSPKRQFYPLEFLVQNHTWRNKTSSLVSMFHCPCFCWQCPRRLWYQFSARDIWNILENVFLKFLLCILPQLLSVVAFIFKQDTVFFLLALCSSHFSLSLSLVTSMLSLHLSHSKMLLDSLSPDHAYLPSHILQLTHTFSGLCGQENYCYLYSYTDIVRVCVCVCMCVNGCAHECAWWGRDTVDVSFYAASPLIFLLAIHTSFLFV